MRIVVTGSIAPGPAHVPPSDAARAESGAPVDRIRLGGAAR
jgi:hypothetical protein